MNGIRLRQSVSVAAAVFALCLSAALPASTNRFFNAEFDVDTNGWGGSTLFPDVEDRDGCSESGAAFFSGVFVFTAYIADIEQCIPVFNGETLHVRGEVRLLAASAPTSASVQIDVGSGCTPGTLTSTTPVALVLGAWTRKEIAPLVITGGQTTAVVHWVFGSSAFFDVLFDRAYASDLDQVQEEGFELGDTVCRWSSSTGFLP